MHPGQDHEQQKMKWSQPRIRRIDHSDTAGKTVNFVVEYAPSMGPS